MLNRTKRTLLTFLVIFIISSNPINSFASGILKEYYPPSDSDFFQKRITYQYYNSPGVTKIVVTQYKYPGNTEVIGTKEFAVKENSRTWIDFSCKGSVLVQWKNSSGGVEDFLVRGQTDQYLGQGDCTNFASLSNYNEELGQYADDTFGATKKAPGTPPKDGSGGVVEDPGSGGTDPTDPTNPTEPTDPTAPPPYWDDYMKKVDEIISKIPPPPDWPSVAQTFRDTIAPRIKQDLQDVLGSVTSTPSAPSRPSAPSDPGNLNDNGFRDKAPKGNEAAGLGNASFSSEDIKAQAPIITERADPNKEGFKVNDPLLSLPSQEEFMNNLPKPESGVSPNPDEQDLPTPSAPKEQENQAPSPTNEGATAPTPNDNGAAAPVPDDNGASAPIPTEGATAPIPGEQNGTAPIPGATNETAPIPGQP